MLKSYRKNILREMKGNLSRMVSLFGIAALGVMMLTGPNHKRLLPASLFLGAVFLLLADLTARTLLSPIELPIGVVTSLIGSVVFVVIFYRSRKDG